MSQGWYNRASSDAQELLPCRRFHPPGRRRRDGVHAAEQRTRPAPAQSRQARAVRVRPALGGAEELPLRDQLLPDRDALHPLRHRGDLPVSGGHPPEGVRPIRARRDDRVHRSPARGLRVRVAKRGPRVEVTRQRLDDLRIRQVTAQRMLKGDVRDEDLEQYVEERLLFTTLEKAQNWARANAVWPATFGLACCAIEMISVIGSPRNDLARFGAEVSRASPRQADMLILSGRVSIKMAPVIRRLYDQMLEPKWVISMGACASSAGMFNNYALVAGADRFLPIDIYIPGCPPRPEALMYGIIKLQKKIMDQPDLGWRERYRAEGTEERA